MNHYSLTTVTPPAHEPVDLSAVKVHTRIDDSETHWDDDLRNMVAAAREMIEAHTGRSLVNRTLRLTIPQFPGQRQPIYLPAGPVRSITSIEYTDAAGVTQTLDAEDVQLFDADTAPSLFPLPMSKWPETQADNLLAVRITYEAGNSATIPAAARRCILLLVGHWWNNREAVTMTAGTELPLAVERLLNQLDYGEHFRDYGTKPNRSNLL